jgi:hypothetical protein
LSLPVRVNALGLAASAFLSTLVHRPQGTVSEKAPEEAPAESTPSVHVPFTAAQQAGVENRCPVCQARFRGARICSRCGADLKPLMVLTVRAWQLREEARRALGAGDVERALLLATEAQSIHDTENGGALRMVTAWLAAR